ncbi:MAG: TetR/AcrR family transcriptional regulator [Devosia sp.]
MAETAASLNLRKRPRQERSRQTCAVILTAAANVIETKGLAALTTNRAAERAGVSIGSLYQYFPDKEAILVALIREMRRDMLADILSAAERGRDKDLGDAMGLLIEASLRHHLLNPVLTDALEHAEKDLPLDAETRALKSNKVALIVDVLARHGIENPEQTTKDVFAMCRGIVEAALEAGERDFHALSARLNRAVTGYLQS